MIIKTSPDEIQNYLADASNIKGNCDAVYIPETVQEIVTILIDADKNKTPVTVSGNGTGLTGARVPAGGIVISTEKLNNILEINKDKKCASLEPGVILEDFQEEVKVFKLMYPPDPTEKNCFIGGNVATNASGEKTFKYGPTRDYILGLDVVLPDGDRLYLSRGENIADGYKLSLTTESGKVINITLPEYEMPDTKNASGYFCKKNMDAIDLFIGSEGTLGIVTKVKVKLVNLPHKIISCVVFFDNEDNALSFIQKAREISINTRLREDDRSIDALALEFFDEKALLYLKDDYSQIPDNVKAGVWFEQEVNEQNEDSFFEYWLDLISEFNGDQQSAWFAVTDADKRKIQQFRHSISVKVNEFMAAQNMRKVGTDVAVPHDKFTELYHFAKKITEQANLKYVAYGHFGNSHLHLNMLPVNQEEFEKSQKVYSDICDKAIELNGTVSAEHGIGKLKTDYLLRMYGEENIKKMAALKKSLDPNLILGIGNIFDKKYLL